MVIQETLSTNTNHRYKQLDSLRGIAALTVFIGHSIGTIVNLDLLNKITPTPLSIFYNGYAAVMFFFVLSGFVLSLPFMNNERPLSLTAFYIKRIFRIYPAFIVAILLSVLLKEFVYDRHAMASSVLWFKQYWAWDWNKTNLKEILRTFLLIGPSFKTQLIDPPIWSLVVEMKMSILLPFFILIVSRCGVIINIGLFLVISYVAYRYTGLQISVFYWGVLLAKYQLHLRSELKKWPAIALVSVILISLLLYNTGLEFLSFHSKPYYIIFSNYLPAIGSCIIIISVLASKRLSSIFQHKTGVFLGSISYSFYLMHFPVLIAVTTLMINRFAYSVQIAVGLAFLLTIAIAWLMMLFIERPFQRIASRLVKKYRILNACNIKATGGLKSAQHI
jgi:peptidoglycan/LPS O-acetylase OafA/YrhL